MADKGTTRSDRRRDLAPVALAAIFAGLFGLFAASDLDLDRSPLQPISIPWFVLGLIIFGLSLKPLNFEIGSGGMYVDLSEMALVLGLYCTTRFGFFVAVLGGLGAGIWIRQRRFPVKILFNVCSLAAAYAAATFVFDLGKQPSIANPMSWLITAISVTTFNLTTFAAVCAVLRATGDSMTGQSLRRTATRNVIQSVFTAAIGLSTLLLLVTEPIAGVMIAIIIGGIVGLLRVNERNRRDHEAYRVVHRLTEDLRACESLQSTLLCVAEHTQKSVNATSVAIVTFGIHSEEAGVGPNRSLPSKGDLVWEAVITRRTSTLLFTPSTNRQSNAYLRNAGLRDLIAAPLLSDGSVIGMLVAFDHRYKADMFRKHDVELLEQIAAQASTTVQNHDLIGQLRVEAEKNLHEANHDTLTGLPNRTAFLAESDLYFKQLNESYKYALPEDEAAEKIALFFMDLNQFKAVNDSLGHHAGDQLLITIAERIRSVLPAGWSAARLGGDEFAGIGRFVNDSEIDVFVNDLQEEIMRSVDIEGARLTPSAAIGVAVAPEHGTSRSALMRRADVAMYAAKGSGNKGYVRYHPDQENVTARQLELITELRNAIPQGLIELCFQPKAELRTGRITGVEALARWNHPRYGAISPDEFIPLAEQAGLIDDLTDFVIAESTRVSRVLSEVGLDVEVSVNIAARTLRDIRFPDRVLALLAVKNGIVPHLKFEITEREIVLESATTNEVMARLRAAGVRFSIDDFGTGYSSLAYLIQLPVDEVKVDKSFTAHVCDSPHHRAIVKSVVDIAATIGLTVVAEGVEDVRTWEVLGSLGCAEAQGYLLSRPLSASALQQWLLERSSQNGPLFTPFIALQ
jgi:diguanylate cyclase (GGDEF)-like protein